MDDPRRPLAGACGSYCGACDRLLAGACSGCAARPAEPAREACPVYVCVLSKGLEHCGVCPDWACQVFLAHAGPLQVARHYRALCRRTETGTGAWLDEQERQARRAC